MIICFSGTGNSRRVANALEDALGEDVVRFAPGQFNNPEKIVLNVSDSHIIWVLPVHGWGLPKVVSPILKNAKLIAEGGEVTHHLVLTCGDDIGYADKQWRRLIENRGWKAGSAFSVQMPNCYTFMKGFDVDSSELAQSKLDAMPDRLLPIIEALRDDRSTVDVVRGAYAWVKSKVLYPWFMAFKTNPKPFRANEGCNGCRRCARNCPMANITIKEGRPVWGSKCTMCSRCYHLCPQHAVEYGRATGGKGQYICPGFSYQK